MLPNLPRTISSATLNAISSRCIFVLKFPDAKRNALWVQPALPRGRRCLGRRCTRFSGRDLSLGSGAVAYSIQAFKLVFHCFNVVLIALADIQSAVPSQDITMGYFGFLKTNKKLKLRSDLSFNALDCCNDFGNPLLGITCFCDVASNYHVCSRRCSRYACSLVFIPPPTIRGISSIS